MNKVKLIIHEKFNGKQSLEDAFVSAFQSESFQLLQDKSLGIIKQIEQSYYTDDNGTNVIVNTYDVDGIRQSKTVNGEEHKYVTLDGKIVRETANGVTVDYFYDNEGRPYMNW